MNNYKILLLNIFIIYININNNISINIYFIYIHIYSNIHI